MSKFPLHIYNVPMSVKFSGVIPNGFEAGGKSLSKAASEPPEELVFRCPSLCRTSGSQRLFQNGK